MSALLVRNGDGGAGVDSRSHSPLTAAASHSPLAAAASHSPLAAAASHSSLTAAASRSPLTAAASHSPLTAAAAAAGTTQAPPSQIFDQSAALASCGRRGQPAVQCGSASNATVGAEKAGSGWGAACNLGEETETRRDPVLQSHHLECDSLTEVTECALRNFSADEEVALTADDAVKRPAPRAALFRPFSDHVVTKSVQTGAIGVSSTSEACCGTVACVTHLTASLDSVKDNAAARLSASTSNDICGAPAEADVGDARAICGASEKLAGCCRSRPLSATWRRYQAWYRRRKQQQLAGADAAASDVTVGGRSRSGDVTGGTMISMGPYGSAAAGQPGVSAAEGRGAPPPRSLLSAAAAGGKLVGIAKARQREPESSAQQQQQQQQQQQTVLGSVGGRLSVPGLASNGVWTGSGREVGVAGWNVGGASAASPAPLPPPPSVWLGQPPQYTAAPLYTGYPQSFQLHSDPSTGHWMLVPRPAEPVSRPTVLWSPFQCLPPPLQQQQLVLPPQQPHQLFIQPAPPDPALHTPTATSAPKKEEPTSRLKPIQPAPAPAAASHSPALPPPPLPVQYIVPAPLQSVYYTHTEQPPFLIQQPPAQHISPAIHATVPANTAGVQQLTVAQMPMVPQAPVVREPDRPPAAASPQPGRQVCTRSQGTSPLNPEEDGFTPHGTEEDHSLEEGAPRQEPRQPTPPQSGPETACPTPVEIYHSEVEVAEPSPASLRDSSSLEQSDTGSTHSVPEASAAASQSETAVSPTPANSGPPEALLPEQEAASVPTSPAADPAASDESSRGSPVLVIHEESQECRLVEAAQRETPAESGHQQSVSAAEPASLLMLAGLASQLAPLTPQGSQLAPLTPSESQLAPTPQGSQLAPLTPPESQSAPLTPLESQSATLTPPESQRAAPESTDRLSSTESVRLSSTESVRLSSTESVRQSSVESVLGSPAESGPLSAADSQPSAGGLHLLCEALAVQQILLSGDLSSLLTAVLLLVPPRTSTSADVSEAAAPSLNALCAVAGRELARTRVFYVPPRWQYSVPPAVDPGGSREYGSRERAERARQWLRRRAAGPPAADEMQVSFSIEPFWEESARVRQIRARLAQLQRLYKAQLQLQRSSPRKRSRSPGQKRGRGRRRPACGRGPAAAPQPPSDSESAPSPTARPASEEFLWEDTASADTVSYCFSSRQDANYSNGIRALAECKRRRLQQTADPDTDPARKKRKLCPPKKHCFSPDDTETIVAKKKSHPTLKPKLKPTLKAELRPVSEELTDDDARAGSPAPPVGAELGGRLRRDQQAAPSPGQPAGHSAALNGSSLQRSQKRPAVKQRSKTAQPKRAVTQSGSSNQGQDVSQGRSNSQGQEVSKERSNSQGQEVSKERSNSQGQEVSKGRSISQGKEVSKGRSSNQGQEVSKGSSNSQGQEVSKGRSISQGQEVSKGRSNSQGQEVSKGRSSNQGQEVSQGRSSSQGQEFSQDQSSSQGQGVTLGQSSHQGQEVISQGRSSCQGQEVRQIQSNSQGEDISQMGSSRPGSGVRTDPSNAPRPDSADSERSGGGLTEEGRQPRLSPAELSGDVRLLVLIDGLFYRSVVRPLQPPDLYAVTVEGERCHRPYIYTQEELLNQAVREVRPASFLSLVPGTRVTANWSPKLRGLFPGTVTEGATAVPGMLYVEFDDGDSGYMRLEGIRLLPPNYPTVEHDQDPLDTLHRSRRRRASSGTSSQRAASRLSCQEEAPRPADGQTGEAGPERRLSAGSAADQPRQRRSSGGHRCRGGARPAADTENERQARKKRRRPSPALSYTVEKESELKIRIKSPSPSRRQEPAPQPSPPKQPASEPPGKKKKASERQRQRQPSGMAAFLPERQLWHWLGRGVRRPASKGKAKRVVYTAIGRDHEQISVGDCAVFLSAGLPDRPYVGRIHALWEATSGQMLVQVAWFYHPEETVGLTQSLSHPKGALFESAHMDQNDVQTISHGCRVLSLQQFRHLSSAAGDNEAFYRAGAYDPTKQRLTFEQGVVL